MGTPFDNKNFAELSQDYMFNLQYLDDKELDAFLANPHAGLNPTTIPWQTQTFPDVEKVNPIPKTYKGEESGDGRFRGPKRRGSKGQQNERPDDNLAERLGRMEAGPSGHGRKQTPQHSRSSSSTSMSSKGDGPGDFNRGGIYMDKRKYVSSSSETSVGEFKTKHSHKPAAPKKKLHVETPVETITLPIGKSYVNYDSAIVKDDIVTLDAKMMLGENKQYSVIINVPLKNSIDTIESAKDIVKKYIDVSSVHNNLLNNIERIKKQFKMPVIDEKNIELFYISPRELDNTPIVITSSKPIPVTKRQGKGEERNQRERAQQRPSGNEEQRGIELENPVATMNNDGNICYAIATLQALANLRPWDWAGDSTLGKFLQSMTEPKVLFTVGRFLNELNQKLTLCGTTTQYRNRQEDAGEFLGHLLDVTHQETHTHGISLQKTQFEIVTEEVVLCSRCKRMLVKQDLQTIRRLFLREFPIDLNKPCTTVANDYKCEKCAPFMPAQEISNYIKEFPQFLIIQVMRFDDYLNKLDFEIPIQETLKAKDFKYTLASVIHHIGTSILGGHYICEVNKDAFHGTGSNNYVRYNDSDSSEIPRFKNRSSTAYILIYQAYRGGD